MDEAAPQREHRSRDVFNALRWLLRAGCPWRMLPDDLPPWMAVQQQAQRLLEGGLLGSDGRGFTHPQSDRAQVADLAKDLQEVTGKNIQLGNR